ncbi:MAG: hypothetical protein LN412_08245 [Candidatus Thermoplasmatota archaeon]|nr:hypothetical protein [Candidatus Thermoplasmatota archaeon]
MTDHLLLVALRLAIVAVGSLTALWSLRLALRSHGHRRTYLLLALGFGLLTLGAVVEGVLFEFAGWDLMAVHTVEAFISAAGFVAILLSIVWSQL